MVTEIIEAGQRDARGHYGREAVKGLLENYRESGLSQKRWCEGSGVKLATLGYWLRREREEQEGYRLVAIESARPTSSKGEVKVRIGGVELTIEAGAAGVTFLAQLIGELGS